MGCFNSTIMNADFAAIAHEDYIELSAGGYYCSIAQSLGSCVYRLHDNKNGMEIFRYKEGNTLEEINSAREIWGLPTLFLPNRFDKGRIKTSDGEYFLPINETNLQNHLHGFVHKRAHKVERCACEGDKAIAVTSFLYDEGDELWGCFPVSFKITYTFTLSGDGLLHEVEIECLSDKRLPISLCTHTCINSPICDGGSEDGLLISVPIGDKCELDSRCLPTEKMLTPSEIDLEYKKGIKKPVLQDISNDMFEACMNTLDDKDFYGVVITDTKTGRRLCNEVSKEYIFWNIWNHGGFKGYFCPEPMTAMINCPNLSLPAEKTGYCEISKGEKYTAWQKFFTM